jgi:photosystem II stability/assembly factor-like uncharacterized protein
MNMPLPRGICFMANLKQMIKKTLLIIPVIFLFLTACERQGDKFPRFEVKETLLGKINDHVITNIFFLDEQTGFAAISKDTIIKTTDGCKTFTLSLADSSADFQDIRFVNEKVGFVVDRKNCIFKTTDGGSNWEKIKIDIPGDSLQDITCLNQDTIFLAAGGKPQFKNGLIIKSTDGGSKWDTIRTLYLSHIFFINESTGFACGPWGIITTTDSGKTWDTISTLSSEDIIFIDENTGYFSYKLSLFKTIDGGRTWNTVKTITNPSWIMGEDFSRIECLNLINNKDLIFTLNARLIKVTAGGKWYQYEFTRPYYQLQMISKNRGIVYGFENLILVSF